MKVRTRFAPSPTGYLHIGGLRTAIYAYALAKKHGGQFILRFEDTDQGRFVEGATDEIYEMMDAYGITPDESDKHGGEFGPYTQSKRLDLYRKYADELLEKGAAYRCFLTADEAKEIKERNRETNAAFRSPHRELTAAEIENNLAANMPYVIRFKVPENRDIDFVDGVQGEMHFNTNFLDDQVLLKTDGFPTYHLAMLVDDHLMDITHVIRAFEWIPSIPLHVLLYEAMGWEMPPLLHLSTILDPEGGKLSKRKGATSAREFLAEGYLPAAVNNFLMLLGWSSPEERVHGESERELFTLTEFVDLFAIKDLNKSNPVFNREKLEWFNKQYLMSTPANLLANYLLEWLEKYADHKDLLDNFKADDNLVAKLDLVKERSDNLVQLVASLRFFYERPSNIDWSMKQVKNFTPDLRRDMVAEFAALFTSFEENTAEWWHETWEKEMRSIADKYDVKHGDAFMLLRVVICGSPFSPPLFESLQVLGRKEVLERLESVN